jgi:hypothetical protein
MLGNSFYLKKRNMNDSNTKISSSNSPKRIKLANKVTVYFFEFSIILFLIQGIHFPLVTC